jgi:sigma-B regulation protein RsbU (phosphoserine phosphatase)
MTNSTHHTKTEKLLLEAARRFNATLDYEELIEQVLRLVMAAVEAEAALVFRVDHERTSMKIRFMNCRDYKMNTFDRELGQGVVGWVAKYREPVIVNDAATDPRVDAEIEKNSNIKIKSVLTVPLIGKGQMIGVIEAINKTEGEFTDADLDVLMGLANQIAVAVDNAALYRAVKQEALERNLLYEIGMKLSSSLSLDEVLQEILSSLKQVVDYSAGGIYLVDPDKNEIGSIYTVGYDPAREPEVRLKVGQGVIGYVANSGKPVIVPDVFADDRYVNARQATKSEIVVPMMLDERVIGVVNLESDMFNAYDDHHVSLLSAFASQAAISIERARLHEKLLSGQKLEQQLGIAREIQRSFLPTSDPDIPGYDIAGRNISSEQVGGDYYDFIRIVDNHTAIAIGDVSGKGVPAALIMASFRASMIAEIRNNYSIRTICTKVNNLLCESLKPGNFVTAVYGVLDSKNHILTFANCGHDLPILLRNNSEIEYLKEGGQVLGITRDAVYEERPLFLNPGEIVIFYTDGVTEVFDSQERQFGVERLIRVVEENRNKTCHDIQGAVYDAVKRFASPQHVFDDFTMIVLKRL